MSSIYSGVYDKDFDYCKFVEALVGVIREFKSEFTVVCIGTDRVTGDAFGPFVGNNLLSCPLIPQLIGTIDDPCHALSIPDKIREIKFDNVLAIDACMASEKTPIHKISLIEGPVCPGSGVGKNIEAIGDYSIKVTFCKNSYPSLYEVRLRDVLILANLISQAIEDALFIISEECN